MFNHGDMRRDFTYVDDIVEGVARVLALPPERDAVTGARHAIYNIGNNQSVPLLEFIATLESLLGKKALRVDEPMQPGDVKETFASIDRLAALTGFTPRTPLAEGLAKFVEWYRGYYKEA